MEDFYFLIAIHFHQPVGNFDSVVERACRRCYEPFLDTIAGFPEIKLTLHYSGCLLEWFKQKRPRLLTRIRRLVRAGQVELMGGGFYEPIFPVLPPEDSIEQIRMLSDFLKEEFGVSVSGSWLAERVWEPHLAGLLSEAGIRYTIVDDTHFRYAGLNQEQLYGYFLTEENGRCLAVLPSDKILRYAIPFHPPQESIDYFRKIAEVYKRNCVVYGDDGEKFGEWPGTEEWVYKKKWLVNFLNLLRDNSTWLKTARISDYLNMEAPQGRVYLPAASYQEMSEWALPAESAEKFRGILDELKQDGRLDRCIDFIRGGFWRNFLVKYPESNHIHKRMLLVSKRLHERRAASDERRNIKLEDAKKELFRAQCNCAYWHGVFGGLYLYHLRSAIYKHLISAERIMDSLERTDRSWIEMDEKDFDCDGCDEFIVNTPLNTFIIDPNEGGAVTEWDIKENSLNIVNTLSRRKEAYHSKLKEKVLQKAGPEDPSTIHNFRFSNQEAASKPLVYDRFRRSLFLDHFLPEEVDLKQITRNLYQEQADFIDGVYHKLNLQTKDSPHIEIEREGCLNQKQLRLVKRFLFYPKQNKIRARYSMLNLSSDRLSLNFSPELNFSLTQDDLEEELPAADSVTLHDKIENLKLNISFSEEAGRIFRFCVRTISQSERDIEENYQASCVMPVFSFLLNANKTKDIDIDIEVRPLSARPGAGNSKKR